MTIEVWDYDGENTSIAPDDQIESFTIPMPGETIQFNDSTTLTGVLGIGKLTLSYNSYSATAFTTLQGVGSQLHVLSSTLLCLSN